MPANVLRISSDAARNLNGLAGGTDGRVAVLRNVGSFTITVKDEAASSTAANRFALTADYPLAAGASCLIVYDGTLSRWTIPYDGATGGGGYTDEEAQDAVGTILADSTRINLTYTDATPEITADLIANTVTAGYLSASASPRLFGRSTAGAGAGEEIAVGSGLSLAAGTLSATSTAPTGASYVTLGLDAGLSAERVLTAGSGVAITDAGAGSTVTVAVDINGLAEADVSELDFLPFYESGVLGNRKLNPDRLGGYLSPGGVQNCRLSASGGAAVVDVGSSATVYLHAFRGNRVTLYDGTRYKIYRLTIGLPPSITGLTASTVADIFLYDNAGTLALEKVNWADATTRATAITLGKVGYYKAGDETRLYVGTVYADAAGNVTDTGLARHVWSNYNRVPRALAVTDTTDSWNYTTAAFRQARGSSTNKVSFVRGLDEDAMTAEVHGRAFNAGAINVASGIGLGSATNVAHISGGVAVSTGTQPTYAYWNGLPGIGYRELWWLEYSTASGTTTWYGDAGLTFWNHGLLASGQF